MLAPPPPTAAATLTAQLPSPRGTPVYTKWWFWTGWGWSSPGAPRPRSSSRLAAWDCRPAPGSDGVQVRLGAWMAGALSNHRSPARLPVKGPRVPDRRRGHRRQPGEHAHLADAGRPGREADVCLAGGPVPQRRSGSALRSRRPSRAPTSPSRRSRRSRGAAWATWARRRGWTILTAGSVVRANDLHAGNQPLLIRRLRPTGAGQGGSSGGGHWRNHGRRRGHRHGGHPAETGVEVRARRPRWPTAPNTYNTLSAACTVGGTGTRGAVGRVLAGRALHGHGRAPTVGPRCGRSMAKCRSRRDTS